jgi:hypothetical protein
MLFNRIAIVSFVGVVSIALGACSSSSSSGGGSGDGGSSNAADGGGGAPDSGDAAASGDSGGGQDAGKKSGPWYYCNTQIPSCYGITDETQAMFDSACNTGGGTDVSSCPTAGLIGCCVSLQCPACNNGQQREDCFYSASGATLASAQRACSGMMGNWSSTP